MAIAISQNDRSAFPPEVAAARGRLESVVQEITAGKYTTCPITGMEDRAVVVARVPVNSFVGISLVEPWGSLLYWNRVRCVPLILDLEIYVASGQKELPLEIRAKKYGNLAEQIRLKATE